MCMASRVDQYDASEQAKLKARQGVVYSVQENMKIIDPETKKKFQKMEYH